MLLVDALLSPEFVVTAAVTLALYVYFRFVLKRSVLVYEISFLHAIITMGFSLYVYVTILRADKFRKLRWFDIPNSDVPQVVGLFLASFGYFTIDTFDVLYVRYILGQTDGFTPYMLHHILVVMGYCITLFSGKWIVAFMIHLLFAELGNALHHGRRVGLLGKSREPQLWDALVVVFERLVWLVMNTIYFHHEFLFVQDTCWTYGEHFMFWASLFLTFANLNFSWNLLKPHLTRKDPKHHD
eukprot:TRINITY_DN629_c0_g1_i2.p1 TRINITY_DN629_c0_g1~~TRINITY_DN629_c0_g1_i2.p1  ORF type:complete len:241 (+),score=23.57 TRINITY_DN629_c0_g1_i2:350-1072(+)